eukprot:6179877-Pleurochrysis_carterae.AAC.6
MYLARRARSCAPPRVAGRSGIVVVYTSWRKQPNASLILPRLPKPCLAWRLVATPCIDRVRIGDVPSAPPPGKAIGYVARLPSPLARTLFECCSRSQRLLWRCFSAWLRLTLRGSRQHSPAGASAQSVDAAGGVEREREGAYTRVLRVQAGSRALTGSLWSETNAKQRERGVFQFLAGINHVEMV